MPGSHSDEVAGPASGSTAPQPQTPRVSIGVAGAVALTSAVTAVCAGLVSRGAWRASQVTVPWGLALSVAGSVSLVVLVRTLTGRGLGLVAAVGWVCGIGAVLFWHPGGDYLFATDGLGVSFLLGATGAVFAAAGWGGGRA